MGSLGINPGRGGRSLSGVEAADGALARTKGHRGTRIAVRLSSVFVGLVLAVGLLLGSVQYFQNTRRLLTEAERDFAFAGALIQAELGQILGAAELVTERASVDPIVTAETLADRLERLPALIAYLERSAAHSAVFIGYPDRDFFLLRPLDRTAIRDKVEAPDGARYLVQSIERAARGPDQGAFLFFDADLALVERREKPDYVSYDPTLRPWFQRAYAFGQQIKTAPYIFFTTGEVGQTLAKGELGKPVFGVDITLASLSALLARQQPVSGTEAALIDEQGRLMAHTDSRRVARYESDERQRLVPATLDLPENGLLKAAYDAATEQNGRVVAFAMDGETHRGVVAEIATEGLDTYTLIMAVADRDLFAEAWHTAGRTAILIAIILLISIVITVRVARNIALPLSRLAADVGSIRRFDFTPSKLPPARIFEVDQLAYAVDQMKATIQNFLKISTTIAGEKDFDRLLTILLDEIIATTRTEAGIFYLVSDDGARFDPIVGRSAGARALAFEAPGVPLSKTDSLLVRATADERALGASASAVELAGLGLTGIEACIDRTPRHLLAAPVFNRANDLVGVVLLFETDQMDPSLVRFTEALVGSAAISVEARHLIAAQRQLFESFIQLIAGAIDAKSPYTGGHCARVPELTNMLAAAAERADHGPFADFRLTPGDWEAIHVAAWLHDCGKVTTPDYVVDKATKLETIYDRIHEVRMRVEVMKRDAEIAHLKRIGAGADAERSQADLERALAELDADFAFLAACNIGGEAMSDEDIARLQALSKKTWSRTLDDRQGVSEEERRRLERTPASPLPATEPLIGDKPHHLFERPEAQKLAADNPWGFRMDVPRHLYNRGEVYNLSVRRGTLTAEDRYKINEHIVQTIRMLSALPFPKHLRHVPELAGGHHEKMDGTGYPKRLRKEDMSPVARMMAIADIFEALTAIDRPYKKGKTLSGALRIMSFMAKDNHIDQDLFDLFLTSGVYRQYAERYLEADQMDEVDIEQLRLK